WSGSTSRNRGRGFLLLACLIAGLGARALAREPGSGFVRVRAMGFEIDGAPYRYVGTNFWMGMNLGSSGPGGDRARLLRELDRLQEIGVTNLRIMAASEGPN